MGFQTQNVITRPTIFQILQKHPLPQCVIKSGTPYDKLQILEVLFAKNPTLNSSNQKKSINCEGKIENDQLNEKICNKVHYRGD